MEPDTKAIKADQLRTKLRRTHAVTESGENAHMDDYPVIDSSKVKIKTIDENTKKFLTSD